MLCDGIRTRLNGTRAGAADAVGSKHTYRLATHIFRASNRRPTCANRIDGEHISYERLNRLMTDYVECRQCGFILLSDGSTNPQPKRVDACPGCDGNEFEFTST